MIQDLEHSYDEDPVLHGVSLNVATGESLALLGPSGCGKTTLLRLIAGLERPSSGSITIGEDLVAGDAWVPPDRRRVGMVFQDWALFPHLSVAKNVAYGLTKSSTRDTEVAAALEMMNLAELADRMPATLSGGQQQRVALARALAPRPGILLLDEPFSNLDTSLRIEVRTEVRRLLADLGITSIFVTHDQDEAFIVGDRVAVMRQGEVVQTDSPQVLYHHPVDQWTAEFVGTVSVLKLGSDYDSWTGDFPRLVYCHPRGFERGPRELLPGQTRAIPGTGIAPLTQVLRTLQEKGYAGPLSVELFLYQQDDPYEMARQTRESAEPVMREAGVLR